MEDSWVPVHWIMEDNGVPVGFLSELNLLLQYRRHVLKIIFQPKILCSIRFSIYAALFFICKLCSFDLCSDTVAVFSFPSENSSSSSVLAPIVIFTSAGVSHFFLHIGFFFFRFIFFLSSVSFAFIWQALWERIKDKYWSRNCSCPSNRKLFHPSSRKWSPVDIVLFLFLGDLFSFIAIVQSASLVQSCHNKSRLINFISSFTVDKNIILLNLNFI